MGAEEVLFEVTENRQLPDFCVLGRGGIAVWRSQEARFCRKNTKNIHFGGSTVGDL
jgi:hypothetical protein